MSTVRDMTDIRDRLRAAGDELRACRSAEANARNQVQPLVLEALRGGLGPVEVAGLSSYTRERVRQLARENGIEAK